MRQLTNTEAYFLNARPKHVQKYQNNPSCRHITKNPQTVQSTTNPRAYSVNVQLEQHALNYHFKEIFKSNTAV